MNDLLRLERENVNKERESEGKVECGTREMVVGDERCEGNSYSSQCRCCCVDVNKILRARAPSESGQQLEEKYKEEKPSRLIQMFVTDFCIIFLFTDCDWILFRRCELRRAQNRNCILKLDLNCFFLHLKKGATSNNLFNRN